MRRSFFDNPWEVGPDLSKKAEKESGPVKTSHNGNFKNFQAPAKLAWVLAALLLLGWLSTGFYTVRTEQQGIVIRLGKYNRISYPGLNYKLPDPIETVEKVSVTRVNREFIGVRYSTDIHGSDTASKNDVPEESQMLLGDENIIDMHFFVQWRIKDPKAYVFNINDISSDSTVKSAAESAMRQVIGVTKLYDALSEQRQGIEQKAKAILQGELDKYGSGIEVTSLGILYSYVPSEVRDAYRDVQAAKADKEREINEAYSYRNDILPRARGEAQAKLSAATAYKEQLVSEATGEARAFENVYRQYATAKSITKTKMYVEMMERIMRDTKKVIIDKRSGVTTLPIVSQKIWAEGDRAVSPPSSSDEAGSR